VDYVIPANDDASKSINKIMETVSNAVIEGLATRKAEKEGASSSEEATKSETPAIKEEE